MNPFFSGTPLSHTKEYLILFSNCCFPSVPVFFYNLLISLLNFLVLFPAFFKTQCLLLRSVPSLRISEEASCVSGSQRLTYPLLQCFWWCLERSCSIIKPIHSVRLFHAQHTLALDPTHGYVFNAFVSCLNVPGLCPE